MKRLTGIFIPGFITIFCFAYSKGEGSTEPVQTAGADTTFSDIDGNIYNAKTIGSRYWMLENFKATKTADGQNLQDVFVHNNDTTIIAAYGRLYTWPAAVQAAPRGWRLPTKEEWEALINWIGGAGVAGGKLKESGTTHWNSPNTGATNSSDLTLVGGGFRGPDGIYYEFGKHGDYWGTATNGQDPFCVYLYHSSVNVVTEVSPVDRTSGIAFSVRYVKK